MNRLARRLAAAAFACALGTAALAQTALPEAPPVTAVKLAPGETIRMDGTLSDPVWRRAPVHRDFVSREPAYGQPTPYETRMQVAYDDRYVYVGVTALDPKPDLIRDPPVRHDLVLRTQDHVIVYIDPVGKKQSAQFFRISASGSTGDGMHTASDDSEDFAPDFDFDAASARNAEGYTFVLRVPFSSLRYTSETGRNWRVMAARRVPRDQFYWIPSVAIPMDVPNLLVNMQELRGLELPGNSQFLTIRPSVTLRHVRTQDTPNPLVRDNEFKPSLDVKWRASPELVIDGTIKPDFSQVDLDVPQLGGNSRFALFYPEKRPFFFEATDVIRSPVENALYTRTFTEPSWGVRGTWRSPSHAGTAIGVDDNGGGLVLLPGPYMTNYANQPSSHTLAVRELADVGPLQVGGILAARRYDQGTGNNIVAGPDIAWQATENLRMRAQWLRSHTTAQPDAVTGILREGPATSGNLLYFKGVHQTEAHKAELTLKDIGEGFRHDTGFVNQVGIRSVEAMYGITRRQVGPLNELSFNFNANHVRDRVTGETVKTDPYPSIWMAGPRNTQASLELHGWSRQRAASGAPLLQERYVYGTFATTPVPWIPQIDSNFAVGRLADMIANTVRSGVRSYVMVRMRPHKQFEVEPSLSWAALYRDGQQTYRESAGQLKAIWFFDANRSIRLIVQKTLLDRLPETTVVEEHHRGTVASVTYTWRKSMGTVLYVGAGYSKGRFPIPALSRGAEAFVKLQFDWDEVRRGLF